MIGITQKTKEISIGRWLMLGYINISYMYEIFIIIAMLNIYPQFDRVIGVPC